MSNATKTNTVEMFNFRVTVRGEQKGTSYRVRRLFTVSAPDEATAAALAEKDEAFMAKIKNLKNIFFTVRPPRGYAASARALKS